MNIIIQQNNSLPNQETISNNLLEYLYNLAKNNQLGNTSYLSGNLYVPGTYQVYIDKLTTDYPDLNITAGKIYMQFEDPEFGRIMKLYVSSDEIGCTQSELDTITIINRQSTEGSLADQIGEAFVSNTTITSGIDLLKIRNLTALSRDLFLFCSNLTEIGIPSSVTQVGSQVCTSTSLNKVVVEDIYSFCGISSYSTPMFDFGSGCDLYTIQNGQQVKVTELVLSRNISVTNLFRKCKSIESVIVSDGVTSIYDGTFRSCPNLETVTLPSSVTEIRSAAFYECGKLESINLSNVTFIGQQAFQGTKLTSVDLSSLSSLQRNAFINVNTITSVTLGNGVKNITEELIRYAQTVNFNNVDFSTWTMFNQAVLPAWKGTCPYTVLKFPNATSINGAEFCCMCSGNNALPCPQLYLPSLTTLENGFDTTYKNVHPPLGTSPQRRTQGDRRKFDLVYLRDLTTIQSAAFGGTMIQALIINNTTPPTCNKDYYDWFGEYQSGVGEVYVDVWGNIENADPNRTYYLGSNGNPVATNSNYALYDHINDYYQVDFIYVPDSAVNTYKTITGWDSVASKIKGISELNGGVTYPTEADWEAAGKPLALIDAYM